MGGLAHATVLSLSLSIASLLGSALLLATHASAITIGVVPATQVTAPSSQVDVALAISGLGDPGAPSLGAFDLDLGYDPSILTLSSLTFGDPVLGDQLDVFGLGSFTGSAPSLGSVNLFEISFDLPSDLDTLQAGSFVLATVIFDVIAIGTSALDVSIRSLSDADGFFLQADTIGGSVSSVPEPTAAFTFVSGFVILGVALRSRRLSPTA